MSELLRDLKHARRRLARTPIFSTATITTLALKADGVSQAQISNGIQRAGGGNGQATVR
ncbi:MAG: hypothetical protein H7Z40_08520 [Phycisphaerae bacterium]|nr:hypothetical protein [Gemmatimonadaceae bacterium]